jgi:hypothetical protein
MRQVVVHDLGQARAVLAAAAEVGLEVQLRSAPDAAAYAGVGYLQALGEAAGQELVVDCGDDAGLVMAALRTGSRRLAFSGPRDVHARLADMARQLGADLVHEAEPPSVIELDSDEAAPAIRRRFERRSEPPADAG